MNILLIDDEPLIREVLTEYLTDCTYSVTASADGLEAFELGTRWFDLVITDLVMPGWTELDLISELRTIAPDLPIIAMSGGTRAGCNNLLAQAVERFGVKALNKPFSLDQLQAAIDTILIKDSH